MKTVLFGWFHMTVLCAPYIVAWSAVIRIHIQKFSLIWYPYWNFLQEIKESTQTKLALVQFELDSPILYKQHLHSLCYLYPFSALSRV